MSYICNVFIWQVSTATSPIQSLRTSKEIDDTIAWSGYWQRRQIAQQQQDSSSSQLALNKVQVDAPDATSGICNVLDLPNLVTENVRVAVGHWHTTTSTSFAYLFVYVPCYFHRLWRHCRWLSRTTFTNVRPFFSSLLRNS